MRAQGPPARNRQPAPERADVGRFFELSTDLLATLDREGCFTQLNPAWERVLGWSVSDLIGARALDLVHEDDVERTLGLNAQAAAPDGEVGDFENRYRCKDGTYRWLQWNARLSKDTWFGVARDVTERKLLEREVTLDPLTGLTNRTGFIEGLVRALSRLERRGGVVGVLFVDLDRFKVINDGRGHEVGDRFLHAAATRLREIVRGADTVARFGGDEFVVMVEDGASPADVAQVAERVVGALEQPLAIDSDELSIGASVGVTMTSRADVAPEVLVREADIAMYRAKARGGGCSEIFDNAIRADVEHRVRAERELRHALEQYQLLMHYQPIVALPELSVTHCEALARWAHPERGLLAPADFIPLAEESGLIVSIGAWGLETACRQAEEWRRAGLNIGITVNVSTRQLTEPAFVDLVREVLQDVGLPAPSLCLEITETGIMKRPELVAPTLVALKELGVQIAMDDFGSGYSLLTYLRELPLDTIKIDKSFVGGVLDNAHDRAIIAAIISLARETGMSVIAEGVETEALHAEVVALGCELAQGFLYDYPRPAEELALDGYSSRVRPGVGDPLVIREFMRQIGIPARIQA